MAYIITEPAPATTSYVRSGRGGAGNIRTKSSSSTTTTSSSRPQLAAVVPSRVSATSIRSNSGGRFFSGIGGAGNAHSAHERPAISLDEEYRRAALREEKASVGHCGIGGAGNVFHRERKGSSHSSKSSGDESDASSTSSKAKLWEKVGGAFSRR